jgi:hypothetical protein
MSKSDIHADVEQLKQVVFALPLFANGLRIGLDEITTALQSLGNTWQDDEYERFKRCLEPLRRTIDEMREQLVRHQTDLQVDVENLIRLNQIDF